MREDMHFVWFSMWDGFFSPRVSESRPSRYATMVGFGDELWEIHRTWKTIQNAFSRTLRHLNQAKLCKYNVQSCRSWKPREMDLSHNCSLHGGRSEVCENRSFDMFVWNLNFMWEFESRAHFFEYLWSKQNHLQTKLRILFGITHFIEKYTGTRAMSLPGPTKYNLISPMILTWYKVILNTLKCCFLPYTLSSW